MPPAIILVQPEIPGNTGAIGRTCVALGIELILIHPLGFDISDSRVKRAGLDYWPNLDWEMHPNWAAFEPQLPSDSNKIYVLETGTDKSFYDLEFQEGDYFLFGKETVGFSAAFKEKYKDRIVTLPFPGKIRSFNLANCVSMVMSHAFSQFIQKDQGLGLKPSC